MTLRFAGKLFCNLQVGHILVIRGKTTSEAKRFDINFASNKSNTADLCLHLSYRFDEQILVRNSYIEGGWGEEEREENLETDTLNPFSPGETFKIYILCGDDRFHISTDNYAYCTYLYRTHVEDITALNLWYDVQTLLAVDHRRTYPFVFPLFQVDGNDQDFSNDIPRSFAPGDVVVITAVPYGNPMGKFDIAFTDGLNTNKEVLHISTRFDSKTVVRNSTNIDGDYLSEEQGGGFPFIINQLFRMAIGFTDNAFLIAVNGQFFAQFMYRSLNLDDDDINGFATTCDSGIQLQIVGVDHLENENNPTCNGFHLFSAPQHPLL